MTWHFQWRRGDSYASQAHAFIASHSEHPLPHALPFVRSVCGYTRRVDTESTESDALRCVICCAITSEALRDEVRRAVA